MQDSRYTTQAADYRRFFVNGRTLALALGYRLFRAPIPCCPRRRFGYVTLFIADMVLHDNRAVVAAVRSR
ncbi:MAG: hypothetical protein ACLSVD_14295 [Eggerthellaceae bacterium]